MDTNKKYHCYVIWSKSYKHFYIGITENIEKSKITKKYKLYDDEKKPQTQSVEKIPIKITTRTNI